MMQQVDADALAPLLSIAEGEAEGSLRIAALDAATRFPLTEDAWRQCAGVTRRIIVSEPEGSPTRRSALNLAVRIPLLSVRRHLRDMAANPDVPDGDIVAAALDEAGDPSRIRPLLERARTDRGESFERLAAMPVEDEGVAPAEIAPLPQDPVPNARLWRALLLARLGEFAPLDAILEGGDPEPELFWGDPWSAYSAIASMRPVPQGMREHLLGALARLEGSERVRMVRLIVWAATGIADAEGTPITEPEIAGIADAAQPAPPPSPKQVKQAITVSTRLPKRLFDRTVSSGEIEILTHLPSNRFAQLVKQIVIEGNKRARALPPGVPASETLGNQIIFGVPARAPAADWPVAELAMEHVKAERPALDDGQMAWLIARDQSDHLIKKITVVLKPDLPAPERLRILNLLGTAADHKAGRGGSPGRGAGPDGEEAAGRGPLIDDMPRAAARVPRAFAPAEEAVPPAEAREAAEGAEAGEEEEKAQEAEERRVHAQVLHEGRRRQTFVTGADNVIRCWIGLPEPERGAVAEGAIPRVEIPLEGLPLIVELCWRDQSDHKPLLLPPDRTARTGDCDLRIHVPAGEPYVSAEIVFRYRGRAFEVVRVEAFALPAGEPERPDHAVKVRIEARRREVIELPDSSTFDSTIIWGADRSPAAKEGPKPPVSLRVFGGHGGKHYDLKHTDAAIKWLNEALFVTEKSLVRRRAAAAPPGGEETLAADDAEVLALLRDMARHGAVLYNQLEVQGFEDPGERIQLLNRAPDAYVPLEFVYDRGYPADDAKLCNGWLAALQSDERTCPVCSQVPLPRDQRSWVPVICPLGFWSLQKIIERLDPGAEEEGGAAHLPAPRPDRRSLPVIDSTVFASSHKVPEDERKNTWAALQQNFRSPTLANNWDEWKTAVERNPPLLLVLPHHGMEARLDYLQIGDDNLPPRLGQLNRGQLTELYVNPNGIQPGPILLLLGCRTGAQTEVGYVDLARSFQQLKASIVLGTLAQILGRHAAPLARELVGQLVELDDPQADFGTIMRRVRRRMLARGYLMALCLVALGDAEWRLTPRPAGGPH
jgi:hypothetical protein